MKTGTPNFFPLTHSANELELFQRLIALGMRGADTVYVFDVDRAGHAGRYRLEYSRLNGQWGYYVHLDGQPVLNSTGREDYAAHRYAEDLLDQIVRLWMVNLNNFDWNKSHFIVAEAVGESGKVQLLSSGVILVDTRDTEQLDREMKHRGGAGTETDLSAIGAALKSFLAECNSKIDVKFYRE